MTSFLVEPASGPLHGSVVVPGDKSIGHRALLFSLLCDQPVVVVGLGDGADNGRSAKAITALGAKVTRDNSELRIVGAGLDGLQAPQAPIDCGNSGTTIRLLTGLLAGQHFESILFGDESLSKRPMKRVITPLQAMGARITGAGAAELSAGQAPVLGPASVASGQGDIVPPLRVGPVSGQLRAMHHQLPIASAQVKTALVLASLFTDGVASITEPGPSRDHSERMLRYFGVPLTVDGRTTTVRTAGWSRKMNGGRIVVPGDPSSSAFLVVAALLVGTGDGEVRCRKVMVNETRTGFIEILRAMGAEVTIENLDATGPEPIADIVVRGAAAQLRGVTIAGDLVVRAIDEIPILAVAAAVAHGTTVIKDADELRVKESDRITATCNMLRSFGVVCDEFADGFAVHGVGGRLPKAGHVDAVGDHRIAMAGVVAALCAPTTSRIDDVDNVATSYPGFVAAINGLGASVGHG
ncbi:MAG: 3-phosphoshikimate 1-carboxyvinyltransferase [Kofleriaceae bacterium]|nr:3-phosphoshikimate 1-carboxyvinyltransferase [Kofleriaceae bacterium]